MNEKIKAFLDGLLSPTCIIDTQFSVQYANYDFLELSQITPRDIRRGITITQCLALDAFTDGRHIFDQVTASRETVKLREVKGRNAKGKYLSLGVSFIPAPLLDEQEDAIILVFTNLTEEEDVHEKYKKLYEKERSERKKLEEFNVRLNELVDEKTKELKKAYLELSNELEIARTVQDGLLPKELPALINMDVATEYIPTGRVGGDLYDIIITKDRKIAILILDVSGHGVPAALIAAMAKMLFLYYIERGGSPAEIFSAINTRLCTYVQTGHYLTAFLAFIDPSNNSMVFSRAGHVEPIIYRSHTKETSFLESGGLFLGHPALRDLAKYQDYTLNFNWHDKLILYTDGLTEAINTKHEMYGKNTLSKIVQQFGESEPEDLIVKIINDNKTFRKKHSLDDDLSLLCIRIGCNKDVLDDSGFTVNDSPGALTLSSHDEIEGICSIILRELDKNGYPTNHFFHAHLCIHEMLANAVRHGNKYDKSKKVIILYKVNLDSFTISILDEGDGFDYTNLPNPLLPENITKEYGRGLFLVKNYMDEIEFNKKGNRILAKKHLNQSV